MIINHKNKKLGNSLATPIDIFKLCCKIWNLKPTLDVCATRINTKCLYYFTEKDDALSRYWIPINYQGDINNPNHTFNKVIWCNPPHEQTKEFVIKAHEQWKYYNLDIIMLIPINCMTSNYFKKFALPYIEFKKEMILSRIRFLDPETNEPSKFNSVNGYVTICFKHRNG